jgi:hypothetical protein
LNQREDDDKLIDAAMAQRGHDVKLIDAAMAEFPKEFGLRAYPNRRFNINKRDSYVNDRGEVLLYVHINMGGNHWSSFAKGTVEELKKEVTPWA